MKKLLILFVSISALYGCVPAAVVVGATAGGAIVYDKRSFADIRHDKKAENDIRYWIESTPELRDTTHISVAVYNGIALMVGQAETVQIRDRIYQAISNKPGIRRVFNGVTIGEPIPRAQRANDAIITSEVRTVMVQKPGLSSNDIKVVTEDSVVYLLGRVNHAQGELATDAARNIGGVSKVVKVFEYI